MSEFVRLWKVWNGLVKKRMWIDEPDKRRRITRKWLKSFNYAPSPAHKPQVFWWITYNVFFSNSLLLKSLAIFSKMRFFCFVDKSQKIIIFKNQNLFRNCFWKWINCERWKNWFVADMVTWPCNTIITINNYLQLNTQTKHALFTH